MNTVNTLAVAINTAIYNSKLALGSSASAGGVNSTALGRSAAASGVESIALGNSAAASGDYSTALGCNAKASMSQSTALGRDAVASEGRYSTALGCSTNASRDYSTALGYSARANGNSSVALGHGAKTEGKSSIALAHGSDANGEFSIALGYSAEASGDYSIALGYLANASGNNSTALGYSARANGNSSVALGYRAEVTGDNTIQLGNSSSLSAIKAAVDLTTNSDGRDKTDISDVDDGAVEFLRKIKAIRYVRNRRELYIDEEENLSKEDREKKDRYGLCAYDREAHARGEKKGARIRVGVIAQEVQEALRAVYGDSSYANLVNDNLFDFEPGTVPEDVESQLTVNYSGFIPFLIKAVQELAGRLEALEGGAAHV